MKKQYGLILTLLGAFAAISAHADSASYSFTVNTSSLATNYGYIDLELNQGTLLSPPITATITGFATDGTLNPADLTITPAGDFSGTLPGTLTITADTNPDYFEGITFGNRIIFDLTLAGPGVSRSGNAGGTSGTLFQLSFFDSTGSNPVLTTDPSGINSEVSVDATGVPTALSLDPSTKIIPEPSTFVLAVAPLFALVALARRGARA
jgi:hypothetical protein